MFTKEELQTVLNMIGFTWENGGVRSESQALNFNRLRVKTEQALNPAPAAPTPADGGEKKKCGKCGGYCSDCGDCGGEKKEAELPKGPPKAKVEAEVEAKAKE